jgi:predicted transglutaminase-like cysteine proteinase
MTPEQRAELEAVNAQVNAIPYVDMPPGEPPDLYIDEPAPGDGWVCRMYAQRKATLLRAAGWPALDLTEVLCYVETGERHAILRVMVDGPTGAEAWILDSRFPDITPMQPPRPGYRYEAEQVAGTTRFAAIA